MLVQHLGLELGHVDLRRAFALASLALQAQVEGFVKGLVVETVAVAGQFAGHRQAEQVGAAARRVDLVARDHVAGAHRAAGGLAAGTDARAHLDRPGEAPLVREVEDGGMGLVGMVVRADPQVVAGIGVADDLAGVEPVLRVEGALDGLERGVDLGPEQLAVPEAAGQAVAVLAAHRAAELDHQVGDLARDRPQASRRRLGVLTLISGRMCRQPTSAWP